MSAHVSFVKVAMVRSESYRRWVASQACAACGILGLSQAAHPNHNKGKGMKTSDLDCFPMCSTRYMVIGCHVSHDTAKDGLTRDERRAIERRYTERTQALARKAGRPEFNE